MPWGSVTRVTRLPQASRDAVWQRICGLSPVPSGMPQKPVCCYAIQGTCYFGATTCEFSHDTSAVTRLGCQFGSRCRLGHAPKPEALRAELGGAAADLGPVLSDAGLADSARPDGCLPLVECRGPVHDDSDPLWQELVCALCEESESVGDADLSVAARERLGDEGIYRLVDDDTADEWVCISAEALRSRLEAAREKVTESRNLWLYDDLFVARGLWSEIVGALRPQLGGRGKSGLWEFVPQPLEGGVLGRTLALVDVAMQRVVELYSKDKGIASHGLASALFAAQGAVTGLQRATSDAAALRLVGMAFSSEGDASSHVDEDVRGCIVELLGCLDRCVFTMRAGDGHVVDVVDAKVLAGEDRKKGELATGTVVEVLGLTSSSEQGLNGQEGQLERYDEALGLWQLRLAQSGTRLLLGEDQLASLRRNGTASGVSSRGRSRSPRRLGDFRSLAEVAQEAAKNGDFVLVHHVVVWTGIDAKSTPA